MNKYDLAAINAVKYYNSTPSLAWEKATLEIFGNNESQKKSCPRSTFLGLCEEGLVKNIPKGNYSKSKLNKEYAISAIKLLKKDIKYDKPLELWKELKLGNKIHNSQMNVVLALWNNRLINMNPLVQ